MRLSPRSYLPSCCVDISRRSATWACVMRFDRRSRARSAPNCRSRLSGFLEAAICCTLSVKCASRYLLLSVVFNDAEVVFSMLKYTLDSKGYEGWRRRRTRRRSKPRIGPEMLARPASLAARRHSDGPNFAAGSRVENEPQLSGCGCQCVSWRPSACRASRPRPICTTGPRCRGKR